MMFPTMERPSPLQTLIPAPRHWHAAEGACALAGLSVVRAADGDLASFAASFLAPALRRSLAPVTGPADLAAGGALDLVTDAALPPEHYRLDIAPRSLTLTAAERPGFARGLASLYQLFIIHAATGYDLPCGAIDDGPAFGWRGLLLDSGRHFQPVERVRAVIDRLAVHRFNVLHWHLTEDQGWRLEVPGLPNLTSIGARRAHQQGGGIHEGFYTAADVREVVAYAGERGITVVPEIEMPGHSQAALAAYPELSCTGGPFAVQTQWGVFPDIYCAGREETFAFLETVLAHVLDLFPSPFIHVGGDEAPKERWQACPRCQERLRTEGLRDEHELQSWFVRRMGAGLSRRGRRLVGWDEILEGGLAGSLPGAVVQSWRGFDGARAAVVAGHDTVVSPTSHAYFDYDEGVLDVARVLAFTPVPPGLPADQAARVLGGACNLWTEYAPAEVLDRRLFPRLPAMAEALWTAPAAPDVNAFLTRLRMQAPVWHALGIEPGVTGRPLQVTATFDAAKRRHVLRVTTQGALAEALAGHTATISATSAPTESVHGYQPGARPEEAHLPAGMKATRVPVVGGCVELAPRGRGLFVRLQWVVDGHDCGAPEVIELDGHLGVGAPVTLATAPARGEASLLTDGAHGSWRRDDGRWCGCEGADLDACVDLGAPTPIGSISLRCLQDANERIFLPDEVRFLVSRDGIAWQELGACTHDIDDRVQDKVIHAFTLAARATARHVRVQAAARAGCPAWHPEAGGPAWVLADEIVVRG
jgi:hexosaminidase